MDDGTAVLITGGSWKGCLGIVGYQIKQHNSVEAVYIVYIDRLGQVAISISDMIEATNEVLDAPDFTFIDPQVSLAEFNLRLKTMLLASAQERYDDAIKQLEACKNGGTFDKARAAR